MHYFLVFGVFFLLLAILALSIALGRRMGFEHLKKQQERKLPIVLAAESAVFGLLGLLIAFTFSGAYDRYESRKMHLVEEANIFDRAYNYIDLMPKAIQPEMRTDMREYFEQYLAAFNDIPYMKKVEQDLARAQILEDKIWQVVVDANATTTDKTSAQIYIVAFNDMFESAHKGYYLTQIHPPDIIFILLISLAVLGAFLVGYNSAETKHKWPLHSICYVILTTFTIYIIANMEYPRVGFIDLGVFDKILLEVRANMK